VANSNLQTSAGLRSCTEVVTATAPFDLDGKRVVLIDTPGFDDTTKSDSDILKLIADFLANS
jgi:predicted GTPase